MNERLTANFLSGMLGIFFGLTVMGMAQHDGTVAGFGFFLFILVSIRRWKFWHDEGE